MLNRVWIPSPNYSSRGSDVRLIVLHTAEGALTYQSLGSYFSNPNSQVSSHVGIDDTPNVVGEYVHRNYKAWTQGNANPYSVAAEMCAFAGWSPADWSAHPTMLENCAKWIAEESAAYGIPIVRLTAQQAQDGRSAGVCQHVDLGAAGGSHWDCGPSFPMDSVITMAKGGVKPPAPTERSAEMIAATSTGEGYWTVTRDGAIYAFGDAQNKGSPYATGVGRAGGLAPGATVIGIAGRGTDGYWLYASDGGIFAYGSAPYKGRPDRS
jgi:hypothetical protein